MRKSLLIISDSSTEPRSAIAKDPLLPAAKLAACGYHTIYTLLEHEAKQQLNDSHAAVLHLPLVEVKRWGGMILQCRILPILWWCSPVVMARSAADHAHDVPIDGILTPTMNEQQIRWALHLGVQVSLDRQQWLHERTKLEKKIEERKWIERAKGILCTMKNITEAEAYELLRKQAMNERKRLIDVASSVVTFYHMVEKQS